MANREIVNSLQESKNEIIIAKKFIFSFFFFISLKRKGTPPNINPMKANLVITSCLLYKNIKILLNHIAPTNIPNPNIVKKIMFFLKLLNKLVSDKIILS